MRIAAIAIAALTLLSCTIAPTVTGPYASRVSQEDVRQIRSLASRGPSDWPLEWPLAPVHTIMFLRPDRAKVERTDARITIKYEVEKHAATWMIKPYSAEAVGPALVEGRDPRLEALRPQIGH